MWRSRLKPWTLRPEWETRARCRVHYFHIDDTEKENSLWMMFFVTKGKDNTPVDMFNEHEAGRWYCYVFEKDNGSKRYGPFNSRDECRIVGKLHAAEHYRRCDGKDF